MESAILNKDFEFTMPLMKEASYRGPDGFMHIKFAIASGLPDKQRQQFTDNGLNEILKQAKGYIDENGLNNPAINVKLDEKFPDIPGINIDDSHRKGIGAIIGPVVDAWLEKKQVMVDLRVSKLWEPIVENLLDVGAHLGGSVHGKALRVLPPENGIQKIDSAFLAKAALTDIPAAWDTRGSATVCPAMGCQVEKSLSLNIEKALRSEYEVNPDAMAWARTQIANGNIDSGPWNKPNFNKFNNDINKYKNAALAVHPEGDQKLFSTYGFEISNGNGKISRQGVIAAKNAAAGGRSAKGKNSALYDAADLLLQSIDREQKGGGDDVKKGLIDLENSYEGLIGDINGALNDKYGTKNMYGNVNRPCYIRYTLPDSVIVQGDDEDDLYQIPYTYTEGPNEPEVMLGQPVAVELQAITKTLEDAEFFFKNKEIDERGGNMGNENIPEGLDEGIIEKLKGLPEEGKEFIKGLFKPEEPEGGDPEGGDPAPEGDPEPEGGDPQLQSVADPENTMTKEMVQEMIDAKVGEKDEIIKDLKDRLDKRDDVEVKAEKKSLLKKSLDLHKKLKPDMTPEEESTLVKEIKADLDEENGLILVERDCKTMTKDLESIHDGDLPDLNSEVVEKKKADKYADEAAEIRKEIDEMGTI